jgi:hypothetical protein
MNIALETLVSNLSIGAPQCELEDFHQRRVLPSCSKIFRESSHRCICLAPRTTRFIYYLSNYHSICSSLVHLERLLVQVSTTLPCKHLCFRTHLVNIENLLETNRILGKISSELNLHLKWIRQNTSLN